MALASQSSRRYAKALLLAVDETDGEDFATVSQELSSFAEAVGTVFDLRNVLNNPGFTIDERHRVLDRVTEKLQISDVVRKFLRLVTDRARMGEITEIAETFSRLADERAGKVRAVAESASELSPTAVDQLKRALERRTGRTIDLEVTVDPSLIGGVRARVGSLVFDGTIRSEIDRLKVTLSQTE